jgi:hypothetical protein
MAIPTSGSVSTEVPAGLQTEFRIAKATFDPDGRFGPQVELDIEMVDEKFVGTQLRYWASVQRPRLDLVRKYRGDGMSDKLIAEALRERGHKCKKIDEEDTMTVGRGGKGSSAVRSSGPPRSPSTASTCSSTARRRFSPSHPPRHQRRMHPPNLIQKRTSRTSRSNE